MSVNGKRVAIFRRRVNKMNCRRVPNWMRTGTRAY